MASPQALRTLIEFFSSLSASVASAFSSQEPQALAWPGQMLPTPPGPGGAHPSGSGQGEARVPSGGLETPPTGNGQLGRSDSVKHGSLHVVKEDRGSSSPFREQPTPGAEPSLARGPPTQEATNMDEVRAAGASSRAEGNSCLVKDEGPAEAHQEGVWAPGEGTQCPDARLAGKNSIVVNPNSGRRGPRREGEQSHVVETQAVAQNNPSEGKHESRIAQEDEGEAGEIAAAPQAEEANGSYRSGCGEYHRTEGEGEGEEAAARSCSGSLAANSGSASISGAGSGSLSLAGNQNASNPHEPTSQAGPGPRDSVIRGVADKVTDKVSASRPGASCGESFVEVAEPVASQANKKRSAPAASATGPAGFEGASSGASSGRPRVNGPKSELMKISVKRWPLQ
eukprot:scaffold232959_cov31-Prasinocladus_malaysianus.AAC.1